MEMRKWGNGKKVHCNSLSKLLMFCYCSHHVMRKVNVHPTFIPEDSDVCVTSDDQPISGRVVEMGGHRGQGPP